METWKTEIIASTLSRKRISKQERYSGQPSRLYIIFFMVHTPTPTHFPHHLHYPPLPTANHQPYATIPFVLSLLLSSHFSRIRFSLVDRWYTFRIALFLLLVSEGLYGALRNRQEWNYVSLLLRDCECQNLKAKHVIYSPLPLQKHTSLKLLLHAAISHATDLPTCSKTARIRCMKHGTALTYMNVQRENVLRNKLL